MTPAVGDEGARTPDPLLAKQVLSQLSYIPEDVPDGTGMGLGRLELPTSRLSGVRSNQLSYRPGFGDPPRTTACCGAARVSRHRIKRGSKALRRADAIYNRQVAPSEVLVIPRKEVIQPQVLLRLPCYDLVPVTGLTVGASLPKVGSATLGTTGSRGLTGGVYKAQEHIHRANADARLLAIPASCGRIAAHNPYWDRVLAISLLLRVRDALSLPL